MRDPLLKQQATQSGCALRGRCKIKSINQSTRGHEDVNGRARSDKVIGWM